MLPPRGRRSVVVSEDAVFFDREVVSNRDVTDEARGSGGDGEGEGGGEGVEIEGEGRR